MAVRFAAIDFETADTGRDSACALSVVMVHDTDIVQCRTFLIRPPGERFLFSWLHGITWEHVRDQPSFAEWWPHIRVMLDGVSFVAAHNAPFDRSVLRACCGMGGIVVPPLDFVCTVKLARNVWGIHPTKLDHVCRRLGIPLQHHDPASDARACARIVTMAMQEGYNALEKSVLSRGRNG